MDHVDTEISSGSICSDRNSFLMILAMALYKFELTEEAVTAGITAVYLLSTFAGDLWRVNLQRSDVSFGELYLEFCTFAFLLLITWGIYRTFHGSGTEILMTFALCAGGGMAGGMIS